MEYKTVEEMAKIWKVTPRYVQNLCKSGRVNSAIKKAGIWLIPEDIVSPVKKNVSDNKFEFSGTKKNIFETAIELFMMFGFESVSMRDIAGAIGIKQAAIYNHFESKQNILDTIYDFFRYYFILDRPTIKEIEPIIENGSLLDIVLSTRYDFNEKYVMKLTKIIKIIFNRLGIDEQAKKIAKELIIEGGNESAKGIFDRAVEMGRLAPFDTHMMGVFINSIRLYTLQNWLIDDSIEYSMEVKDDEQLIYLHATKILTDLKPPIENGWNK